MIFYALTSAGPRGGVLKSELGTRGFQHLPRGPADVNVSEKHVWSLLLHKTFLIARKLWKNCFKNFFLPVPIMARKSMLPANVLKTPIPASRKLLRIKLTPDLHLTYSKNGGNLRLVLKMKNIACLSILMTKHVKYTYLYLFKFVLYSIVAFKAN